MTNLTEIFGTTVLMLCLFCLSDSAAAADQANSSRRSDVDMKVDLVQDLDWKESHFTMSNCFYEHRWGEPAAQIQLLKERGYDSVMLSLKDDPDRWEMLPAYLAAMEKHQIRLAGIHARFFIEDGTYPAVIKKNLALLKDTKAILVPSVGSWMNLPRDDPEAVAMAVAILREMSGDATRYGLGGVAPYLHVNNWIETIDDGLRISRAVDRRNVGISFHLFHWLAVGSSGYDELRRDLFKAKPYLMFVIVQGTDTPEPNHQVLGQGSFDMLSLVRVLQEMDYRGPLGTMLYGSGENIPGKLKAGFLSWERIKREAAKP